MRRRGAELFPFARTSSVAWEPAKRISMTIFAKNFREAPLLLIAKIPFFEHAHWIKNVADILKYTKILVSFINFTKGLARYNKLKWQFLGSLTCETSLSLTKVSRMMVPTMMAAPRYAVQLGITWNTVTCQHWLNMELDLPSYLGFCIQLYSLAETPELHISPRIWAHDDDVKKTRMNV